MAGRLSITAPINNNINLRRSKMTILFSQGQSFVSQAERWGTKRVEKLVESPHIPLGIRQERFMRLRVRAK
jgi:hypothetical protein